MDFAAPLTIVRVVLFALCLADTGEGIERGTTCEDLTVLKGQKAAIKCHFGRDVNSSKTNIDVQFYPSSTGKPVSVLRCNWLVIKPDEPTCSVKRGCNFMKNFSDTVEVEIKNATKDFEGTYMCRLVPSRGIPAHACSLTVKDGHPTQDNHEKRKEDNIISTPKDGINRPERTENLLTAVTNILAIIAVCLIGCILVLLWRNRRLRQERNDLRRKTEISSGSESPALTQDASSSDSEETLSSFELGECKPFRS